MAFGPTKNNRGAGNAGEQLVQFRLSDAERISKAVTLVEGLRRPRNPSVLPRSRASEVVFRVCTFTGSWSIGASKTVTFKNQTTTPNTVAATNLFYDLPNSGTSDCAIAKDGTAWYLVQEVHTTLTVITGASLTTAGLQFTRAVINVVSTATASVQTVGTTAC